MFKLLPTIFLMVLLAIYVGSQMTCNPVCTPPAFCDTNTGICRNFRQAFNGPVLIQCANCPAGTQCDSNTGICRTFRQP
ncbi:hypothetical protein L3Y34_012092 [Caenorhabditis briggsae]|uniref:Uncharacterized protein n=2 Tax=Caenorhabditis briggsae TaxID=6238 RepID=A0AAE9CW67_CAEBR|nr:hypothetical protein L3Y34_012092 [Caenorhabditis briggsae]